MTSLLFDNSHGDRILLYGICKLLFASWLCVNVGRYTDSMHALFVWRLREMNIAVFLSIQDMDRLQFPPSGTRCL